MAVGAAFNGTSSVITSSTGNDFTSGAFTLAAMVYNTSATIQRTIVSFANGGGATPNPRLVFDSGNVAIEFADGNFPPWTTASIASNTWYLVVITKAAGTNVPKLYLTSNGSTWSIDGAAADAGTGPDPSSTIDVIQIGAHNTTTFWNGEIATIAYANTEANASTAHGLVDFSNWSALTNLRFFTGTSLVSGGTMDDTGSGNNDETSRTAISAGSQTVPSWFLNFGTPAAAPATSPPYERLFGIPGARGPGTRGPQWWRWRTLIGVDPPVSLAADGTASNTLDNVTSAATGTVANPVTGTASNTLANLTSTATAIEGIPGSAAGSLAGVSSSASGTETITGTGAQTLAGVSSSATGTETISGSAAGTLAGVTSSASGTETISGSSASTLAGVSSSATGAVANPVTGTGSATLDGVTSSASGTSSVNITGTASNTLAGVTSSASGTETISGTAARTLDGVSSSGTAAESMTGSAANTLTGVASAASGAETITGTSAPTLTGVTSSASGTAQINVTGTGAATLGGVTSSAAATIANPVTGTATASLGGVTGAASGTLTITGTGARTLAGVSSSGAGTAVLPITGTGSATLQGVTSQATSAPIPPALLPPVYARRPAAVIVERPRAARAARPPVERAERPRATRCTLPAPHPATVG